MASFSRIKLLRYSKPWLIILQIIKLVKSTKKRAEITAFLTAFSAIFSVIHFIVCATRRHCSNKVHQIIRWQLFFRLRQHIVQGNFFQRGLDCRIKRLKDHGLHRPIQCGLLLHRRRSCRLQASRQPQSGPRVTEDRIALVTRKGCGSSSVPVKRSGYQESKCWGLVCHCKRVDKTSNTNTMLLDEH